MLKEKMPIKTKTILSHSEIMKFDPNTLVLSSAEINEVNFISSTICDELLKGVDCKNCIDKIRKTEIPSDSFHSNLTKLLSGLNVLIPDLCSVKQLKQTLFLNVTKFILKRMGCKEHHKSIKVKFINCAINFAIKSFCKDVNYLLSKKTVDIPNHRGIQIFDVAFSFRKKSIGKYTGISN